MVLLTWDWSSQETLFEDKVRSSDQSQSLTSLTLSFHGCVCVAAHKSSKFRLTMKAGSVITSVPTLTWPCSTYVTACFTVSLIRSLHMTMGNLRLQNADTVTFSKMSLIFAPVSSKPMSYSLDSNCDSCLCRNGSSAGSVERRREMWRNLPTNWLYLE